jgi:hypothetical protein
VYDRQDYLNAGVSETDRLICLFGGKPVPVDPEPLWADPRDPAVIEAARTDAVIKQYGADLISLAMAQEKLGYTPDEIRRMSDDIRKEALTARGVELVDQVMSSAGSSGERPPPR